MKYKESIPGISGYLRVLASKYADKAFFEPFTMFDSLFGLCAGADEH